MRKKQNKPRRASAKGAIMQKPATAKSTAATARKPAPKPAPKKPGPAPEVLKLEGDWEANVAKSLTKKKPAEGWPK